MSGSGVSSCDKSEAHAHSGPCVNVPGQAALLAPPLLYSESGVWAPSFTGILHLRGSQSISLSAPRTVMGRAWKVDRQF